VNYVEKKEEPILEPAELAVLVKMLDDHANSINRLCGYRMQRVKQPEGNVLLQTKIQRFLCIYDIASSLFDYKTSLYDWTFKATGYKKPGGQTPAKQP
jgi:hypothetical protein